MSGRPHRAERIGIVLHNFPPGGTERVAIRLANLWAASGRDVTMFCGIAEGPALDLVGPGVTVREADPPIRRGPLSRLRLGLALRRMMADQPVDALVVPGNFHIPVLLTAGALDCAIVCKISNPLLRRRRSRLARAVLRASLRHVARLVAMSPSLAVEIAAVSPAAIATIAEPVVAATGAPPSGNAGTLVVCAGRMVPQKAFSRALRAFALLGDSDARLLMLGDGPGRRALEAKAAELGLGGRVTFAGHVPSIAPALQSATVFLLTSDYEGYPAVLVEAILAGAPVVTTNCSPAIPEILFDRSFGIAAGNEPNVIAAALRQVIAGPAVDDGARQRLAERHDAALCASRWLTVLDSAAYSKGMRSRVASATVNILAGTAGRRPHRLET